MLDRTPPGRRFCAVRFGNVLGSRGSVIPTFQRQIAAGGPVTVTDPRMTRFFMSIREAVQLVLQAAAISQDREVFMLEMGEPVNIYDLAERMITLCGYEVGTDIEIQVTGMRPGERLTEQLRDGASGSRPPATPRWWRSASSASRASSCRAPWPSSKLRSRAATTTPPGSSSWRWRSRHSTVPSTPTVAPTAPARARTGVVGATTPRTPAPPPPSTSPEARQPTARLTPPHGVPMPESSAMNPLGQGRRVVVVGQGYVGLGLAMQAVEAGHAVVGYELDDERVKRLAAGDSHVEDVPDDQLAAALATERYLPTSRITDCSEFDVCVIAVPTPLRDGVPDLSYIEEAGAAIAGYVRTGATVVLESTTYPGTTEELLAPILEAGSGLTAGVDFHVGYSPERIDPGNREWTLANTPKVVSGIDAASLAAVQAFYDTFVERTVAIVGHEGGRAHQAPREHVPPREHRAGQRARDVRPRPRHRRLGGDRRRVDQAVRVHALRARARRRRPLPPDRPELPVVAGPPAPRAALPVRRARQRRQRPHARLRRAPDHGRAQPAVEARPRLPASSCSACRSSRTPPTLARRRRCASRHQLVDLGADVRAVDPLRRRGDRRRASSGSTSRAEELTAADAVVVVTDHDAFDYDAVAQHARLRPRHPPPCRSEARWSTSDHRST